MVYHFQEKVTVFFEKCKLMHVARQIAMFILAFVSLFGLRSKKWDMIKESTKEHEMKSDVTVFRPFPFTVGQKIRIEESRRRGDWEVVSIGEHKITLKCPISKKEFEWTKFCYQTSREQDVEWPQKD